MPEVQYKTSRCLAEQPVFRHVTESKAIDHCANHCNDQYGSDAANREVPKNNIEGKDSSSYQGIKGRRYCSRNSTSQQIPDNNAIGVESVRNSCGCHCCQTNNGSFSPTGSTESQCQERTHDRCQTFSRGTRPILRATPEITSVTP